MTPLHVACFVAEPISLRLLLDHVDIDVNACIVAEPSPESLIYEGYTALCFLFMYNMTTDVGYCQFRNLQDQPENIVTIVNRRHDCAKMLLADPRVDVNQGSEFDTVLGLAALYDETILRMLLQRDDIDVNKGSSFEDTTALVRVVEHDNVPVLQLFLGDLRLNVNRRGSVMGETALIVAVAQNNIAMVDMLLQDTLYGLVNTCPLWRSLVMTFLLCNAAMPAPVNIILMKMIFSFLRQPIEVNAQLNDSFEENSPMSENFQPGATALSLAALNGNLECLNLLLAHRDIDASKQDGYGQTPLQLARSGLYPECVTALQEHLA
jgi:ankyrin repeat protein